MQSWQLYYPQLVPDVMTTTTMMIRNVAGFCCQIMNLILILYCTIFFRDETISRDAMSALMYGSWLLSTLVGLTLTAYQGVFVNHVVRMTR